VQAVLVPELAVQLIMEDLEVYEDTARQILSDSARIGDLVNEEDDDVVKSKQSKVSASQAVQFDEMID
jgi:hypothetical protein